MGERAEALLFEELVSLTTHDAFHHPIKGARPPKKAPEMDDFQPVELQRASSLLVEEAERLVGAAGGEELCDDALRTVMQEELKSLTYLPEAKKFAEWRAVDKPNRLEAATHSFKLLE